MIVSRMHLTHPWQVVPYWCVSTAAAGHSPKKPGLRNAATPGQRTSFPRAVPIAGRGFFAYGIVEWETIPCGLTGINRTGQNVLYGPEPGNVSVTTSKGIRPLYLNRPPRIVKIANHTPTGGLPRE